MRDIDKLMENLFSWLPQMMVAGSVLFFYCIMFVWVLVLFSAEAYEDGWRAFLGTLVLLLVFNVASTSFDMWTYVTWANAGIYLGIGLAYAILKVYLFGKKTSRVIQRLKDSGGDKWVKANDIHKIQVEQAKDELKGHVFRWWTLWPVSLAYWAGKDLLKDLWNWVYSRLKKTFESIFELGLK